MTSLPDEICCLISLGSLRIEGFPNLMNLPDLIGNFTSLQQLEIVKCPNLTSLPDGMHHLASQNFTKPDN